jgi:hypothetical protein
MEGCPELRSIVFPIFDWVGPIGVIDSRAIVESDREMDHRTVRGSPMPVGFLRFGQHNIARPQAQDQPIFSPQTPPPRDDIEELTLGMSVPVCSTTRRKRHERRPESTVSWSGGPLHPHVSGEVLSLSLRTSYQVVSDDGHRMPSLSSRSI